MALRGPVVILAGAGTGKTRTITHRIAYGVATGEYAPTRTLALTFTTRAAGELRARLRSLGAGEVPARTFHSAALSQLAHFWPQVVGGTAPRVLEGKARLLGEAADSLGIRTNQAMLRAVAGEIEWRKVSCLSIAEYAASDRPVPAGVDRSAIIALQQAYEDRKDELRRMDFEDVLLATAGMLETESGVAAAVREQYRVFTVDEVQDVSPLQERLLRLWVGARRDLCVVGDANQTIYGFAGATSSFLLGFAREHQNAEVVSLSSSHRSSAGILDLANRLMRGRPGAIELSPAVAGGDAVAPSVEAFADDRGEVAAMVGAVQRDLADGIPASRIGVLVRTNGQVPPIEQALRSVGITVAVRGDAAFFERPEVREAIVHLLAAKRTTPPDQSLTTTVRGVFSTLGWSPTPPTAGGGAARERWTSLDALARLADEAGDETPLGAYLDDLLERQASLDPPVAEAVSVATMHAVKGLEYDSVHVVGVAEGLMPLVHATTQWQLDEERRLLYVAITRARRRLRISSAGRPPSRFLAEILG
jgi:DNA helicase-2/ATP-dependent DNA helicase PcrA